MMQVAILAGGLGTRLRSAIPEGTPKPMAPVAGRPFLEYVLDRAIESGATEFLLLTSYASGVIRRHFGSDYRGRSIAYSVEPEPLGTGGAVKYASAHLSEKFILINGDTYVDSDFGALLELASPLAMTLSYVPDTARYGRVETSGETVTRMKEKGQSGPGYVNAGAYGISRSLLDLFPPTDRFSFEEATLEARLSQLRPPYVTTLSPFIDIGIPEDYAYANSVLAERHGLSHE